MEINTDVAIIGGGFTGLAAAYELSRRGHKVVVLEKEQEIGGLASSFNMGKVRLEKFYHHWFINDDYIINLIKELGEEKKFLLRPTRTGTYLSNKIYRLSSPMDLLRFSPLNYLDRIRLGLMVLRARAISDWKALESQSAEEWLCEIGGKEVYKVVWEPLINGKFGSYASEISAVWFWNKLKLRGGSRANGGTEMLAYYRNGFSELANRIIDAIHSAGGIVLTGVKVNSLEVVEKKVVGIRTAKGLIQCSAAISTQPLPLISELIEPYMDRNYITSLRSIEYLANVCLVLELNQRLSDIYWLNVNDANFPYVGIIEHTNFEPPETYEGRHILYLSKYLPASADFFNMSNDDIFKFSLPYIKKMFPKFRQDWIQNYNVWKAKHSQPIVTCHYSKKIPNHKTPLNGFYISTMAQIYPEDRGTNYAVREGRKIGEIVANYLISDTLKN